MKCFLVIALTTTAAVTIIPATAGAGPRLYEYMCQPLNGANLERCCDASNWRDIIPLENQHLCRERDIERQFTPQASLGGNDRFDGGDDDGDGDDDVAGPGNPGNENPVGSAGEKDDKGMRNTADAVGTAGMSDNPAKSGGGQ